ncbi:hypothetical protein P8452_25823 [Trifolium repens]|nr:hypothetical protein P8452_25823 [Trifolium repens]
MSSFIILSRHPGNNLLLSFDTTVKDQDLMLSMKMTFMLTTVISLIKQSLWTYMLEKWALPSLRRIVSHLASLMVCLR